MKSTLVSISDVDLELPMISGRTNDLLSLSLRMYQPEESITPVSPESFKLVFHHQVNSTFIELAEPVEEARRVDEEIWFCYLSKLDSFRNSTRFPSSRSQSMKSPNNSHLFSLQNNSQISIPKSTAYYLLSTPRLFEKSTPV